MKNYSDLKGDGGSEIVEQLVSVRKQICHQLASVRHIVAIGSGKGGVGKSSLTMQLALSLSGEGYHVAVLDADFNGPSIARIAGMYDPMLLPGPSGLLIPKTVDGIGIVSMGTVLPESQALSFDSVSVGESYVWRATKEFSSLAEILSGTTWGELDFLLVDLPPGPERTFQFAEFFGAALKLLLVTIPSDLSCGVVLRSIAAVEKADNQLLGYVDNMKGYLCPDSGEIRPLFPDKGRVSLGIPRFGEIPFEPMLAKLCDQGLTYDAWSMLDSASYVKEVSDNLLKTLEPGNEILMRQM
jgi:ATP-binding protein involved in chromosome partitioning